MEPILFLLTLFAFSPFVIVGPATIVYRNRMELLTNLLLRGKGFDMEYRTSSVIDITKRIKPPEYYDHRTAKFASVELFVEMARNKAKNIFVTHSQQTLICAFYKDDWESEVKSIQKKFQSENIDKKAVTHFIVYLGQEYVKLYSEEAAKLINSVWTLSRIFNSSHNSLSFSYR
jgi:hypothetical protein